MTLVGGATLGPYRILGQLGRGGMASVYKGFHPAMERTVALKVIEPPFSLDPTVAERFTDEARAVSRLRHPNVIQVFDLGVDDDNYFMAMEFVEGETLAARLRALASSGERMPRDEVVRITTGVAAGLDHAHASGVIHRDVKPANVLLTRDGTPIVTDFGIAAIMSSSGFAHAPGVGLGTPEYMSPEQARGEAVDSRTDVYALGVLAYAMLTGRVPFAGDTPVAVALAHTHRPLLLPSWADPGIGTLTERVLLRALARDPAQRFRSAGDLAAALAQAVRAEPRADSVVAPAALLGAAAGAGTSRRWLLAGLAALVLLSFGAGALAATVLQRSTAATAGVGTPATGSPVAATPLPRATVTPAATSLPAVVATPAATSLSTATAAAATAPPRDATPTPSSSGGSGAPAASGATPGHVSGPSGVATPTPSPTARLMPDSSTPTAPIRLLPDSSTAAPPR